MAIASHSPLWWSYATLSFYPVRSTRYYELEGVANGNIKGK